MRKEEDVRVVRYWYDGRWYVEDVASDSCEHNYWLGCVGNPVKKYLFGSNRPVPMVEDVSFVMKYIKSYIRKYCDSNTLPPANPVIYN